MLRLIRFKFIIISYLQCKLTVMQSRLGRLGCRILFFQENLSRCSGWHLQQEVVSLNNFVCLMLTRDGKCISATHI